ncbi:hypothetical protein [Bdellovibrio sp. BCCA]|uniref:hypothetical protein n=1 Tax=Bdellovibrio sp. BCCA TaxID=3136281 RepID=UPI0030F346D4
MKFLLLAFLMAFSVQTWASINPVCEVNGSKVELLPVVHPNADLASYVFDEDVENFHVRIVMVEFSYFTSIKAGSYSFTQNNEGPFFFTIALPQGKLEIQCH